MKKVLLTLFAFSFVLNLSAAELKQLVFTANSVTVYRNRAEIEKKTMIDLPSGETVYTVKGLPAGMYDNSLVVFKQDRDAPYLVKEYEFREVETAVVLKEAQQKLKDRLTALQEELRAKEDRMKVLEVKIKYYNDLSARAVSQTSEAIGLKEISVKNTGDVLVFIATGLETAMKEKRAQEKAMQKLRDDISITQSELAEVNERNTAPSKELTIRLACNAPVRADLRLKYQVPDAGWYPAYEADYISDKAVIEGKYYAMVYQSTDEKWENVKLTAATGSPLEDVTLPVPVPWIVRETQRVRAVLYKSGSMAKTGAAPAPASEAMMEDKAYNMAEAKAPESVDRVLQGELNIRATLTGRFDISNTGEIKRVPIKEMKLKRKDSFYTVVPSMNEAAYLTAEFENNDEMVMAPGEVSLYMDGNYSGKSNIQNSVRKGESLKFSFGIDENIKVNREKLQEKKGESGIFGNERKVDFGYRLTVENYKQRDITVSIKEPMPFSENDRIKAEMYETSDRAYTDEDRGIRVWNVTLKPGEKKEITYRVRVSFPGDMEVEGI
ncbi:MAG: mucoidy inhibitor MuiA family protein [Spirochaetia bacterium]|nr:mucoidy inhibitor MuiA family protein [Spirochaetia bacterium]